MEMTSWLDSRRLAMRSRPRWWYALAGLPVVIVAVWPRYLPPLPVAEAMRVSRQTINSIETGRYTPSLPLAMALARYFGVTVEEMFDDQGC
jgi:putative transcriptional regulator